MPTLTQEEGETRWKKVRSAMGERGLQCLIIFGSFGMFGQLNANLRYLANAANEGFLIFPLQGEPTLVSFVIHNEPDQWVTDLRSGHPYYSNVIVDRIKELHLENTKIGIIGPSGYYGERGFPHKAYMALIEKLPQAKFEDATDILDEARRIKSPIEIKCIELGCRVGEKVIQTILDTARVGVTDNEVKGKMMETMLRNGCESITLLLYGSGKEILSAGHGGWIGYETSRALEAGDIIITEFDAKYLGYMGQFNQPFSLGKPGKEWIDIAKVAEDSFNNGLDILKPGTTVGELDEAFLSPLKKAGYIHVFPHFHGLGLSLEEPFGNFPFTPQYHVNKSRVIEAGMVIEFEPHVLTPDRKKGLHIGSPVLVTETGCRMLSETWHPELRIISTD